MNSKLYHPLFFMTKHTAYAAFWILAVWTHPSKWVMFFFLCLPSWPRQFSYFCRFFTYPSPTRSFCLEWDVNVNIGSGEGWVGIKVIDFLGFLYSIVLRERWFLRPCNMLWTAGRTPTNQKGHGIVMDTKWLACIKAIGIGLEVSFEGMLDNRSVSNRWLA